MALRQKYRQLVKDQGKMYMAHASALHFKENSLRSLVPVIVFVSRYIRKAIDNNEACFSL